MARGCHPPLRSDRFRRRTLDRPGAERPRPTPDGQVWVRSAAREKPTGLPPSPSRGSAGDPPRRIVRQSAALALDVGGLAYAAFWLLAARAAPKLGSTDLAKESISWLAVPSAGLLLLGIGAVVALTAFELFAPRASSA